MQFPDFDPVLVQIGPIAIRWYALAYVAGILLGWRYVAGLVKNQALWGPRGAPATPVQIDDLILWITLGVILGGRLGHVFFYTPSIILEDPLEILQVWHGGMSFHGGTLGVLVAVFGFCWKNKLDVFRVGDAITACAPIGLFFGRVANFINGELWGRPADVPWAFIFPQAGPEPRHPSQLYEAALEGILLFLILRWATHGAGLLKRRGVVAGMFFLGYAVFRTFVENFREPDRYLQHFPLGLTMGMMLSAPMVIGGLYLIWRGLSEPPAPETAEPPVQAQAQAQTKTESP